MLRLLLFLSLNVIAKPLILEDWKYELTDIQERGLNKDDLFFEMNRNQFTDLPICSNRAHIWAMDFSRLHKLRTAKVFLFFTDATNDLWWYHAAPAINDNGVLTIMDAGLSGSPLTLEAWLQQHAKRSACREMRMGETELLEYIYRGKRFPERTSYGQNGCYFVKTPEGYWTPRSVALGMLGKDAQGKPVHFERPEILKSEALSACAQVTGKPIERVTGVAKKKCKKYFGF